MKECFSGPPSLAAYNVLINRGSDKTREMGKLFGWFYPNSSKFSGGWIYNMSVTYCYIHSIFCIIPGCKFYYPTNKFIVEPWIKPLNTDTIDNAVGKTRHNISSYHVIALFVSSCYYEVVVCYQNIMYWEACKWPKRGGKVTGHLPQVNGNRHFMVLPPSSSAFITKHWQAANCWILPADKHNWCQNVIWIKNTK